MEQPVRIIEPHQHNHMSDPEFTKLSKMVDQELGIKMPINKKTMLESRLQKRLKVLKLKNFNDYHSHLNSPEGRTELNFFYDAVTTNKTDFFREEKHFEFLTKDLLPQYYAQGKREIKIWSCASSTGEEPYTIAIVLEEFCKKHPDFKYSILASDISAEVLQKAALAIYGQQDIDVIPLNLQKAYFLRGTGEKAGKYKVKELLRKKVTFTQVNLMDDEYKTPGPFDIIFCRNVLIYFDRERQEKILNRLIKKMAPNGYLLLGHSESMAGMNLNLKSVATATFTIAGLPIKDSK